MEFFTFFFVSLFVVDAKIVPREIDVDEANLKTECAVQDVYVAYHLNVTAVSWTAVESSCTSNPVYKVQYNFDDNITYISEPLGPNTPIAVLSSDKITCQRLTVKLFVMEDDIVIGQSSEKTLEKNLDDISGVYVNQTSDGLLVTWKPLDLGAACKVTYSIQYSYKDSSEEKSNLEKSQYLIPLEDDTACVSYNIKLQATSNNLTSQTFEASYETAISSVRDVNLTNRNGHVAVDFKPSKDIPEECGEVDYRVMQNDRSCFLSDFIIVPVSSKGTEGVPIEKSITRRPGPVQKIEILPTDDKVYLSWHPPLGGTSCNMAYLVKYRGKANKVHPTNVVLPLQLESCKIVVVQVIPAIITEQELLEGQTTEIELVGDLGPVHNIHCELKPKMVKCEWRKPLMSKYCKKFVYYITYFDGLSKKSLKTSNRTHSFPIHDKLCNLWFNVQPLAYVDDKMWEGEVIEATIQGCERDELEEEEEEEEE